MPYDENDPVMKRRLSVFAQALADLGWTDGRNVRIDHRWSGVDINRIRALAQELVGLQPDIIVTGGTPATAAVQRETRTIPIVFASAGDPVASGIVPRLDRPGGNVTGFGILEASLGGKWLELLTEIAPGLKRAAIMFNPGIANASIFMPSLETAARSLKVERSKRPSPHLGASRSNNVPAVYSQSFFARGGGLLSYAAYGVDTFRRVATYVDRILRGEKPSDLPVQFPTKFEMVVNLKTAKALGLAIPPSILLRADEVIE
jgi:putative ABC transport system substrate-binding protein